MNVHVVKHIKSNNKTLNLSCFDLVEKFDRWWSQRAEREDGVSQTLLREGEYKENKAKRMLQLKNLTILPKRGSLYLQLWSGWFIEEKVKVTIRPKKTLLILSLSGMSLIKILLKYDSILIQTTLHPVVSSLRRDTLSFLETPFPLTQLILLKRILDDNNSAKKEKVNLCM